MKLFQVDNLHGVAYYVFATDPAEAVKIAKGNTHDLEGRLHIPYVIWRDYEDAKVTEVTAETAGILAWMIYG